MRIVGQNGQASRGAAAVNDPVVAAPSWAGIAEDGRQSVEAIETSVTQPGIVARLGRYNNRCPVGIRRQKLLGSPFAQLGNDTGAQELNLVIASQFEAHHLAPGQGIDGCPGGGVHSQDGKLQWQAIPVSLDIGIHPGCVGFHNGTRVFIHQSPVFFCRAAESDGAQKAVGIQRSVA